MAIGRQFGLFGEIDEVIAAGVLQFRKSRPRFDEAGAAGIFPGQKPARDDPVCVRQRSILHREMLPAILGVSAFADIVTANPYRTWLNRPVAAVSIEFDNSGPRRRPPR